MEREKGVQRPVGHVVGCLIMETMPRLGILVTLVMMVSVSGSAHARGLERHAGRLHSLSPAHGLLLIEESGVNGRTEFVQIEIRDAEVVHIWRDPVRPWEWRERRTKVYRWSAGTFVVVIGRPHPSGVIDADRIEFHDVNAQDAAPYVK